MTSFAVVGPRRHVWVTTLRSTVSSIAVSGTRRAIDQAGVADEYAYQLKKRGTELRRDIEHNLIHTYQVAGTGGIGDSNTAATSAYNARRFGGYQSWINTPSRVEQDGFEHRR